MKFGSRRFEVAAQHIRIAFVIEKPWGFALEFGRGPIGPVREIEPPQSIVTRRQSDPGGHVVWRFFNRILKILLRQAEVAVVEPLGAQPHRLIGRIILNVARILPGDRIGDRRRRQRRLVAPSGQQRQHDYQTATRPTVSTPTRTKTALFILCILAMRGSLFPTSVPISTSAEIIAR